MLMTTDELVAKVRIKGRIPDSSDYTDAIILSEADDVISERLVEAISSLRQGLYVVVQDSPCVAGQASYVIPYLAAGEALEGVSILQADGFERPLHRFDASDTQYLTAASSGQALYYTAVGDSVVLSRAPADASESVRFRYTSRRSKMVPVASAAKITGLNTGGAYPLLELTDKPTTIIPTATLDTISGSHPYGTIRRAWYCDAATGSDLGSTTVDVTEGVPSPEVDAGIAPYDFLAVTGETPVVQVPIELRPALANGTAAMILGQMGFSAEAATCYSLMERGIASYKALASNRVKNAPVKFVNRNSPLRMRSRW